MSPPFKSLCRMLCLVAVTQAAHAVAGAGVKVGPSDCRPRDADSTCATAVAGASAAAPPMARPDGVLYDGPLGGVPATGYAYWGFDFMADETGMPSPVRPDEFINRSSVPVTITLTFNYPTDRVCKTDCLPGVQFQVDVGWFKLDPPFAFNGDAVSVSQTFAPGRGFGWLIGLWQATNPRLTVTIPSGAKATLQDVGISPYPAVVGEIAAVPALCECGDGTTAACSDGSRFSNGLLGPWFQTLTNYVRAGAFNNCPPER
jgi:hypothetical protein